MKPVVKWIGERKAMFFGYIGGAIGYAMFGLSATGVLFWFAIPFLNIISFAWPSAQSIMSREIGPSEQGQMQGAVNSLRGIAGLFGPGLFTYIFSKSIGLNAPVHLPGMPFFVASAMLIAALGLMVVIRQTKAA